MGTSDEAQAEGYEVLASNVVKQSAREVRVAAATRGGEEALTELARKHGDLHVLPLFVAEGLLLDKAREAIPRIEAATGARVTCSEPLTTDLAAIVAERYLEVRHA
ncbi:CbiX/SirB N-terminal domain-containing protein [Corynebacterium aquatimens]|uniref:CbiX/SirB N-terminal domain-containing protein n=1 Tax=Corynebacterium aquatimens TaxID=1190508 RepID=UPI002541D505|nr:CbiX/SirB N-terminal domain-containing protein [Corynebacterium aquatimens]